MMAVRDVVLFKEEEDIMSCSISCWFKRCLHCISNDASESRMYSKRLCREGQISRDELFRRLDRDNSELDEWHRIFDRRNS